MSVDSEEEERQEQMKKSDMYKDIYDSKIFLKVFNRKKYEFDFNFPKSSFDRIIELYGKERILPLSFVHFSNPFETTETIRYSSRNINIRTSVQINSILDVLKDYYVYPASFENLDDLEKIQRAPRLKPKYLKSIANKMGLSFSEMINYISLQMTEINVRETTRTVVNVQMYSLVFNLVHLLNVKFPDKESFYMTFFSYRKMMKMAGLDLEEILPYLEILIMDELTREELNNLGKTLLYDKVLHRGLKESIEVNIRDKNIDLYKGIESCDRIPRSDPIIFEPFREEASNLLMKLVGEGEEKEKDNEEVSEEENNDKEEENDNIIQKPINVIDKGGIKNVENYDNKEVEEPLNEDKEQDNKDKELENQLDNNEIQDTEKALEDNQINNEPEKQSEEENKDNEIEKPIEDNKVENEPEKPIEEEESKVNKALEKSIEENKNNELIEEENKNNDGVSEAQNKHIPDDQLKGEKLENNEKENIPEQNEVTNPEENKDREKEEKKEPESDNINIEDNIPLLNNAQNNTKISYPEERNKDKENTDQNINEKNKDINNQVDNYKEPEKEEISENKKEIDNKTLVNKENKENNEPNKENESLNENKSKGQDILSEQEGKESKEPEKDSNKDNIIYIEPKKEDLKENIVISGEIQLGKPNDENEDKNKVLNNIDIENDKEDPNKSDLNIINSKKVLRNKKNINKNKDKEKGNEENKNNINISQNVNAIQKEKDVNNNENNNKIINNMPNNENINNDKVVNNMKKPKKQFKIRRVVFVKVEKQK